MLRNRASGSIFLIRSWSNALGHVPDVRKCVTMDLKAAGNAVYLIGTTREELGGSHYHLFAGRAGGAVPKVDLERAPRIFARSTPRSGMAWSAPATI